jgi:hypothetical protein
VTVLLATSPCCTSCRRDLAARDGADEADRVRVVDGTGEAPALAHVHAVEVDVHEPAQLAAFVEDEIGDRQRAKRVAHRRRIELEAILPAGFGREQGREEYYGRVPTSTDRIGGSCEAASCQLSPASGLTNTEPLCVPT